MKTEKELFEINFEKLHLYYFPAEKLSTNRETVWNNIQYSIAFLNFFSFTSSYVHSDESLSMAVLKQTGNSIRQKDISKFWFKTRLFIISSIFCRTNSRM